MSNRPMSDDEVQSEMKKMVAFIKQEAMEKAREIKVKADEEFAMEEAKIVRQETANLDALYDRKRKQAEVQKKIKQSTMTNKSRLSLLEAREEMLEEIFEGAKKQVATLPEDKDRYSQLLESLTLQGLFTIMEKEVTLSGRKRDSDLLKKAASSASTSFEKEAGFNVKVNLAADLSDDLVGGIKLMGYNNRIIVDNTLDQRLKLLEDQMLPEIRNNLFGANQNRKHNT